MAVRRKVIIDSTAYDLNVAAYGVKVVRAALRLRAREDRAAHRKLNKTVV